MDGGLGRIAESKCDLVMHPNPSHGLSSGEEDAEIEFGVSWDNYRVCP